MLVLLLSIYCVQLKISYLILLLAVCQPIDHSTATTPTERTTGSGGNSTPTNPVGQDQQGDNMMYTGNYYLLYGFA